MPIITPNNVRVQLRVLNPGSGLRFGIGSGSGLRFGIGSGSGLGLGIGSGLVLGLGIGSGLGALKNIKQKQKTCFKIIQVYV